ncbi:hypothetical protein DFO66_1219 [Brevibacterium sanguinis]|uniref:LPXTG-motif cell wall-anchored protein n=2 Tax=Brevibacterium TaxID=1696 RepID=A0A366ID28_9MICO|nr:MULTISPECIES: hypothetical protein [Brevibacterium]RBP61475.1 hypothetical protein DFO66_1219 [Brevibacterium sanguinis]RBP68536.1 hypothetical protein DFO65_1189 [Brevibacterium celere]
MRRLALAATIALGLVAFGAVPVAAADSPSMGIVASGAAGPLAAEAGPEDTERSSLSGEDTDPTGDPDPIEDTDPTGDPDPTEDAEPTDEAEPTEDSDSTESTDSAEPIDAVFLLHTPQLTPEELADPDSGIRYSIEGLRAGDVITPSLGDGPTTVAEDGTFDGTIVDDSSPEVGTRLYFTVTVDRDGVDSATFEGSVEIIAETPSGAAPKVALTPAQMPLSEFRDAGATVAVTGCEPDTDIQLHAALAEDPDTTTWETSVTADGEGAAEATYQVDPDIDDGYGFIGEHIVRATCSEVTGETSLTVTPNGGDTIDPTLTVDPTTVSGADFVRRDRGVMLTARSCGSGRESVRFEVWGTEPRTLLFDRTVDVDEVGTASVRVFGLEDRPEAYVGSYSVAATCGDTVLDGSFTVISSSTEGPGRPGDSDQSASIPRTGAEITGVVAGAVLILLGIGAIVAARRNSGSSA